MSNFSALLKQIEDSGAGFYSRNSDGTLCIWVRGAHGNDPNQWLNARKIEEAFGRYVRQGATPDPMSGHILIRVKLPN